MSKLIKIVTEVLNYSISIVNQKYNINTENLKHNIVTEVISGDLPVRGIFDSTFDSTFE